jgi:shikimate dehydrogenase
MKPTGSGTGTGNGVSDVFLFGHPVAHSLSPAVHNAAFRSLGLPHRYSLRDVAPRDLGDAVGALRTQDALGANVTIPHKEAALRLVDESGEEARVTGAVNAIVRRGSRLIGHNTDAYGFEQALDLVARPERVLLLGAGGAARACAFVLLRRGAQVEIANRTRERAEDLARAIESGGRRATVVDWPERGGAIEQDMVVNATSLGLRGEDPLEGIALPRTVVDIVAMKDLTPLVRRARQAQDIEVVDGSAMLLHQAVRSFELWTGLPAPLEVMRAALPRPA